MYFFRCYGHENITSSHKNTLEFTKDKDITKLGHCIVGVKSDFSLKELKQYISDKEKVKITIHAGNEKEEVNCKINKDFNDSKEIVIRKSEFNSKRTLGIRCDKASSDFSNEFKEKLKDPEEEIIVKII